MNFEEGGTSSQQRAHSGSRGEVRQAAGGGREWHWGCTGRVSRCTGSPSGCTGCRSGCTGSLSGCTGCGFLGVGGGGRPPWAGRGSRRASRRRTCPERAHAPNLAAHSRALTPSRAARAPCAPLPRGERGRSSGATRVAPHPWWPGRRGPLDARLDPPPSAYSIAQPEGHPPRAVH